MLSLTSLRHTLLYGLGIAALSSLPCHAQNTDISATVNSSTLIIAASNSQYAGSIDSLTFRGTQYVYAASHGVGFGGAVFLNQEGQCLNPTEPGSLNDGTKSTSTSILNSISNSGGTLSTSTNMAYWLAPGQSNGGPCSSTDSTTTAKNTTLVSGVVFSKSVTIGLNGVPNLIGYNTSYYFPTTFSSGNFAPESLYFPTSFNTFLSYNPATEGLFPLQANSAPGNISNYPVIISQSNGSSALGIASLNISSSGGSFGYDTNPNTNFLVCAFNVSNLSAGTTESFSCPLAVGTVDEVVSAINQYSSANSGEVPVYRSFKAPQHFYTESYDELAGAGFALEGTDFLVFTTSENGQLVPLYRCLRSNANDHFASRSSNCEGQTVEGLFGYISAQSASGKTAIYRFHSNSDHLVTTNYSEGANNSAYAYDGVLGFAPE